MGRATEAMSKAMGRAKGMKQALTGGAGIFERLATQHGEVGTMIRRVGVSTKDSEVRRELVPRIRQELLAHARAEERVVYPAFMEIPGMAEEMAHAKEEHDEMEDKLDECLAVGIDDDSFFTKWHAFSLEVEKHVIEEEQKIFPKAKRAMTEEQSKQLETKYLEVWQKERDKVEA